MARTVSQEEWDRRAAAVAERRKARDAGVAWKDWPQSDELLAARARARAAGLVMRDASRAEVTRSIHGKVAEATRETGCSRPEALQRVMGGPS